MSRMNDEPTANPAPAANGVATMPTQRRPARRVRLGEAGIDADALIWQVVAELQNQSCAEAERVGAHAGGAAAQVLRRDRRRGQSK